MAEPTPKEVGDEMRKHSIKHNRFLIRVPETYTSKDIELIKVNLQEARDKGEDVIVSKDIEVYPLFQVDKEKEEAKKNGNDQPSSGSTGATQAPAGEPAKPADNTSGGAGSSPAQ